MRATKPVVRIDDTCARKHMKIEAGTAAIQVSRQERH